MACMFDVAKYITEKQVKLSAMKLQKLMYYSQAWHLVWTDMDELFEEDFEAWANGPVIPALYSKHQGRFTVTAELFPDADASNLTTDERETIDRVLAFYGEKTAQWLSDLTHEEAPWNDARQGLPPGAPSRNVITKSAMHEFYSFLPAN